MSGLLSEFDGCIRSIFGVLDSQKYNVAMGYFQGYSSNDLDTSGTRFADIKLHYKDSNGNDIDGLSVPILYIGNENTVGDFALTTSSLLLVLFSDRTLEQWVSGNGPQKLNDNVKDSKNHAVAIPISTHQNISDITSTSIDSTVGFRRIVKSGKKVQIGTDTVDLVKVLYDLIDALTLGITGPDGDTLAGASTIATLKTTIANITKI